MVLPAPATVPARLLTWLLTDANLGEPHKTLAPEAQWPPPVEQDAMRQESRDMLTTLGWRDRHGRLDREVAGSLAVLCRPHVEYYGWIAHEGQTIGILAGRIGKEAVLAVHQPDSTVWLTSVSSTRLAERLVAQTPDVPAGRVASFTVSAAEVRATRGDGRQRTSAGVGVRRARPEVRGAQRLAALPATGHGELCVARRDELGRRHRSPQPLRYTDTSEGRFVLLFGRDDQVRVESAGRGELVRHLDRMSQALA